MLGWGPTLASVAIRRLNAAERFGLGEQNRARRCTVSVAEYWPRDPRTGCSGAAVLPGHPKACVDRKRTWVCQIDVVGGFECQIRHEPANTPLSNENATTDERGVLTLDVPLGGTHAAPPLVWQRRYPHVDGYIHPWTRAGKLRQGLTFDQAGGARHYRGTCWHGSEIAFDKSALRCYSDVQLDPCFPATADWNRRNGIVACADAGWTRFGRFVITKHL